jgi:hypothetical protein
LTVPQRAAHEPGPYPPGLMAAVLWSAGGQAGQVPSLAAGRALRGTHGNTRRPAHPTVPLLFNLAVLEGSDGDRVAPQDGLGPAIGPGRYLAQVAL